ncbi:MAG: transglycosylase, partial [Planctomycetota bacterium]
MKGRPLLLALLCAAAPALAQAPDAREALVPRAWEDAPPLLDDGEGGWASLRTAARRSLAYYERLPAGTRLRFGPRTIRKKALAAGLRRLLADLADDPSPEELAARLRAGFELYESAAGPRVLFTGYYEPVLEGSLVRRPGYEVPVYRVPDDLVRVDLGRFGKERGGLVGRVEGGALVPYWTRRELWVEKKLSGRGQELFWAKNRVDAFFVEVQGSGSVRLPDVTLRRFGYAGSNGHPYRSIGRLLLSEGR